MRVDFATDVGAVRTSNQDSCDCGLFSENSAWVVVCDGMGGAKGGKEASSLAVQEIRKTLEEGFSADMSQRNVKALLLNAVRRANDAVYALAQQREDLQGMGTTGVILVATKGLLHVAHVGDSRAYIKNASGLAQITMDHSYVQDLVNFGQITREEARVHPQRNIITRVLGVHEEVLCDYDTVDFSPGDIALACSDGLTNYTDDSLLEEYMERYGQDGKMLVQRLIQYAVDSGGADNITAAILGNY